MADTEYHKDKALDNAKLIGAGGTMALGGAAARKAAKNSLMSTKMLTSPRKTFRKARLLGTMGATAGVVGSGALLGGSVGALKHGVKGDDKQMAAGAGAMVAGGALGVAGRARQGKSIYNVVKNKSIGSIPKAFSGSGTTSKVSKALKLGGAAVVGNAYLNKQANYGSELREKAKKRDRDTGIGIAAAGAGTAAGGATLSRSARPSSGKIADVVRSSLANTKGLSGLVDVDTKKVKDTAKRFGNDAVSKAKGGDVKGAAKDLYRGAKQVFSQTKGAHGAVKSFTGNLAQGMGDLSRTTAVKKGAGTALKVGGAAAGLYGAAKALKNSSNRE